MTEPEKSPEAVSETEGPDAAVAVAEKPPTPVDAGPGTAGPVLSIKGLDVAYGQSVVLRGIDLELGEKQTLAVMGRNGMGKTTLMKSLIGILGAKSGSITLGGEDVTKLDSARRVKAGLAYVPQGRQIFSTLSVEDNIKTGLETVKKKEIPEYIYDLFPVLKEMRKRKGGNLSGGQQQQLAIARALVSEPKVLLLDEPTEGIQPSIIKDIAASLNTIKEERGISIIVSEQVLSFTMAIADRIAVIETGKIISEDKREDIDEDSVNKMLSV